jgi:hypothetical protein
VRERPNAVRCCIAAVVVIICSVGCTEGSASRPVGTPSQSSTITTVSPPAICGPYLDYIATGFTWRATISNLAANIPTDAPPPVHNAIDFLENYNGGPVPRDVDDALEGWVLALCSDSYLRDVQPRSTTRAAAQTLFDAVQVGDREAARPVAAANALARFDPWGPVDSPTVDRQFIVLDDQTYRFQFTTEGDYFQCTGSSGVIRTCDLIQP